MFRIAAGEELGYDDPRVEGHSIEFRINAEDGGANFMPAPGTLTKWSPPSGPGVRLDGGYEEGETIPGAFDSLIAKLIVTGRDRTQALERSRRALDEFVVDGMPTVIPFHAAVVDDPAFIGAPARTRASPSTPSGSRPTSTTSSRRTPARSRTRPSPTSATRSPSRWAVVASRSSCPAGLAAIGGGCRRREEAEAVGRQEVRRRGVRRLGRLARCRAPSSRSPSRRVRPVEEGDTIVVLEAMKMEQPLKAHKAGTITGLKAEVGSGVTNGEVICEIKDA